MAMPAPPPVPEMNFNDMVSQVVTGIRKASGTFLSDGVELRKRLIDDGIILKIEDAGEAPETMCAVDGGRITKQLYSGDLLVAYATSAEAESAQKEGVSMSQQWSMALPHSKDADKVCGIAMMALEQAVLVGVNHGVKIIDGSLFSPIIETNRTLTLTTPEAKRSAAKVIKDYQLIENLTTIYSSDSSETRYLALPKSDSSRDYGNYLAQTYDIDISVSDKILAAHILQPGEMLLPRTIDLWKNPNLLLEPEDWKAGREIAHNLKTAYAPVKTAANEDRLVVTYLKGQNPLAVMKVEYFRDLNQFSSEDAWVASTVERECRYTHAQEPAAQYKADIQAKGVASIERQLRELVYAELTRRGETDLAALFSLQYRT